MTTRIDWQSHAGQSALALMLLSSASAAAGQTGGSQTHSDDPAVEEVLITGLPEIVRSIGQTKSQSDGVLDTLTNAEIELTSDYTLAEAAARIPGVYGTAFNGQPRFLSLRGFDARYNSTDLDGNPIWNSSENNRGTQLDLLPASAVNQIDVIKALTPDIDANSLGGHISVRTLRAFDGGRQTYVKGHAEYGWVDQGIGKDNYRIDAVGKTTFGDGNIGAVVGFDMQRRAAYQDSYDLRDGLQLLTVGGQTYEIPARGTWRYARSRTDEQSRSVFGKLEVREADRLYAFLTLNYYEVDDAVEVDRRRAFVDTRPDRVRTPGQGTGTATRGSDGYQVADFTRDIDTLLLAGGADYRIGAATVVKARASWSRVRLLEDFYSSGDFEDVVNFGTSRTFDITGDFGIFDRNRNVGTVPSAYVYGGATYEEDTALRDDLYSARIDLERNSYADSQGFGARAGLWWRRLDRDHDRVVREASLNPGVSYTFATNRPDLASVDFFDPAIRIDRDQLRTFIGANGSARADDVLNRGADYRLQEDVVAGYAMGLYSTDRLRVIGGVRIERTDLRDNLFVVTDGVVAPDSFEKDYTEILPSLHVSYVPVEPLKLRLAYTQTLARPDFEAFAFGSSIQNNGFDRTVVTGNRDIGPRLADNFDASIEYYLDRADAYFALGLFHKKIRNEHFAQTVITDNPADPSGIGTIRTTSFSSNGRAQVNGIEASFVMKRLRFLPRPLDGLGLIANYTYLDGRWDVVLDDGTRRRIDGLRNQPQQIANITGLYEIGPVKLSVAYNWAGETFTGEFQSRPSVAAEPALNDKWIAPYGTLDAKLAIRVVDPVELTFAARNLTDATYAVKTGLDRDLASEAAKVGRSFIVGTRIKF
ncbi:TonB-dependent receptor [Sphingomonas sp.]|uniref:TonB-dependent receptor n=1 Tax=Sphingomonas sp. TaxID=28214 RepID=UPI0018014A33|nr:TonB-dependent receptor [Sphingomonas sp.]MBA4761132.1 TonB-dependent receptor [Sphingomonas sp.]